MQNRNIEQGENMKGRLREMESRMMRSIQQQFNQGFRRRTNNKEKSRFDGI